MEAGYVFDKPKCRRFRFVKLNNHKIYNMSTNNFTNLLACDAQTGVCAVPDQTTEGNATDVKKQVQLLYFTDPICSSCWGIEPQLRKLKLEYGDYFNIEYRMGGLLPSWNTYGGKDVSNAAGVAQHWDEVSAYYDMPIDGDIWLEDPLASSYPPSIAFKAAQLQDEIKALKFLRKIKEMVFVERKNIAKWEHLQQAALETGLDTEKLKTDIDGKGKHAFEEDLKLAKILGVRGFPTIFFTDEEYNRLRLYGVKPYEEFEQTLLKLYPHAVKAPAYKDAAHVFDHYPAVTTKEFSFLTNRSKAKAESLLHNLLEEGKVEKYAIKNGELWKRK
jgi:predicted DsbA family dithiol-disulfide isomerase